MNDQINEKWLKEHGFTKGKGLEWSIPLPPYYEGAEIVELRLHPEADQDYVWYVSLYQWIDNHVYLTSVPPITSQFQLVPLLRVLGLKF